MDINSIIRECEQKMDKSVDYFTRELRGIRTGRATTALVDYVKVDYYGSLVDLREIAPASRRDAIRMVPQDAFLFDASIRDNVRYGHAGASDREVETAFSELGLAGWIESLPAGLDTPSGERGEALSVGERQLVALARAQIAGPGLLILDEATSSVDPGTEGRITEALRRLSAGRTVVTIAHRLSTAEHADHVFVMHRGRLIEHGTHAELCAHDGVYARMFASWLGNVAG